MSAINPESTIGQLVAERPARSRVFESLGIDYCCGGKRPLSEICREKKLDLKTVSGLLEKSDQTPTEPGRDWLASSLGDLVDHIESTHHAYLKQELPRLRWLVQRIATVHGERHPNLLKVHDIFGPFADEMESHMAQEERELFPAIRRLETGAGADPTLADSIPALEHEHDHAGRDLALFRELTDNYLPPDDACHTYRATLEGLAELERDMHRHVHRENNILFPRAAAKARALSGAADAGCCCST
jgi:regulator of cell morphogenesis and NO signaling